MARPLVRDDEGLSTFWSFVGVLVLVIAILAVYVRYEPGVRGRGQRVLHEGVLLRLA